MTTGRLTGGLIPPFMVPAGWGERREEREYVRKLIRVFEKAVWSNPPLDGEHLEIEHKQIATQYLLKDLQGGRTH